MLGAQDPRTSGAERRALEQKGSVMRNRLALVTLAAVVGVVTLVGQEGGDRSYTPKRVNKAIELLEQGQPIYYTQVNGGGYDEGRALAQTWADYITYNFEHSAFDVAALNEFMRGLVDGGGLRTRDRPQLEHGGLLPRTRLHALAERPAGGGHSST